MTVVAHQALASTYLFNPVHHQEVDFQAKGRHNCSKSIKASFFEVGVIGRGCSGDKEIYLGNGLERVVSYSHSQGDHSLYLDHIPSESNYWCQNLLSNRRRAGGSAKVSDASGSLGGSTYKKAPPGVSLVIAL